MADPDSLRFTPDHHIEFAVFGLPGFQFVVEHFAVSFIHRIGQ